MDENAAFPQSSIDFYNGYSDARAAESLIKTYSFILAKYKSEFENALNYDEKNDKKFQKEMRKLAREKLKNQTA